MPLRETNWKVFATERSKVHSSTLHSNNGAVVQTEPSAALASLANQLITRQGASSGKEEGGFMCGDFVQRSVGHKLSVGFGAVCWLGLQGHSWIALTLGPPLCSQTVKRADCDCTGVC